MKERAADWYGCAVTDKKGKVHMEAVQRWLVRGKPERAVKNSKHHRIAREGKLRWECVLLSLSISGCAKVVFAA